MVSVLSASLLTDVNKLFFDQEELLEISAYRFLGMPITMVVIRSLSDKQFVT